MTNHTPPPGIDKMLDALTFYEDSGCYIGYDFIEDELFEKNADGPVTVGAKAKESLAAYNPEDWEKLKAFIKANIEYPDIARIPDHKLSAPLREVKEKYMEPEERDLPQSFKDWALGGGNK